MSALLLTAPEREGSTFGQAIRILGLLAVSVIVLVCWAILIRYDGSEKRASENLRGGFGTVAAPRQPVEIPEEFEPFSESRALFPPGPPAVSPGQILSGTQVPPPPSVSLPLSPAPGDIAPPGAVSIPVPASHPAHHIGDDAVRELVERSLRLREEGDTPGCLAGLKDADQRSPGHPKILAELATTYYQIGQEAKSASYWEQVHQMGAERAGAYWDLADMALKGELLEDSAPVNDHLRVSRHFVRAVPTENPAEQRVTLRVHIETLANDPVDYRLMYLQVFFYDTVNESRFEQTIADITPRYVSAPYDWKGGEEEIIEVDYHLPELTTEQKAALGQRSYFGYLIELYYHDVLQDLVAAPRKLARFGSAAHPRTDSDL